MELRPRLQLLFSLGGLGWPVGQFGFGGFDNAVGGTIIGVGSFILLAALGAEAALRARERRRAR